MIKVEVIGNLGADCEVKQSNGNKFGACRVAHTEKYTDAQGNVHESTIWIDIVIPDADNKVIPYLKAGVKVFVRGNASLRVYSSQKDRCMKAGLTINAREIELCGGSSDAVPRQLIDPADGALFNVTKCYWIDKPTKGMKKNEVYNLVDAKGNQFVMTSEGFVGPVHVESESEEESK